MMLQMGNGEEYPFMLDTGMPATVLDKSLESKLGKCLGTNQFGYRWFGKESMSVYKAPKFYLASTKLVTGDKVMTSDLTLISPSNRIMGILGMDCLQHYCMQLDFVAEKIRFLNPGQLDTNNLGTAFPLNIMAGNASTRADFFARSSVDFCVDTGCNIDGMLKPKILQQQMKFQIVGWDKQVKSPAGATVHLVFFDKFVFNDNSCSRKIYLADASYGNFIGLHFLARHLVTLNFPKQMMYLKQTTTDPLTARQLE